MSTTTKKIEKKTEKKTSPSPLSTADTDMLKETSLGEWIVANKSLTLSLVVLIFVGVIGWGVFHHFQEKSQNEKSAKLYELASEELVSYRSGKLSADDFVKAVEKRWDEVGKFGGAGIYIVQFIDALREKKELQKAYDLTVKGLEKIPNRESEYFLSTRAAALAEDLGKNEKALEFLNHLILGSTKYLEDKIYVDLGRLQAKTGDIKKARVSLQYVIEKGKEEEFKKMARLLLSELPKS